MILMLLYRSGVHSRYIPLRVLFIFKVHFLPTQNPKNVARIDMHRPDADCRILTQRTWEVVQNEVIENLFAIVQKTNVQVSMSVAMI